MEITACLVEILMWGWCFQTYLQLYHNAISFRGKSHMWPNWRCEC